MPVRNAALRTRVFLYPPVKDVPSPVRTRAAVAVVHPRWCRTHGLVAVGIGREAARVARGLRSGRRSRVGGGLTGREDDQTEKPPHTCMHPVSSCVPTVIRTPDL